ncbi:hypothetical protein EVAR_73810_1 [Eumeta japonica]|uniref:Uncharacterized protein n=1 Tax=Eumeta variegata TaxID=151549 RepID=A0A4C1SB25_EUMVA|nr:hypothetical protein EVAR_73810_1 [Eumeta japonica]
MSLQSIFYSIFEWQTTRDQVVLPSIDTRNHTGVRNVLPTSWIGIGHMTKRGMEGSEKTDVKGSEITKRTIAHYNSHSLDEMQQGPFGSKSFDLDAKLLTIRNKTETVVELRRSTAVHDHERARRPSVTSKP